MLNSSHFKKGYSFAMPHAGAMLQSFHSLAADTTADMSPSFTATDSPGITSPIAAMELFQPRTVESVGNAATKQPEERRLNLSVESESDSDFLGFSEHAAESNTESNTDAPTVLQLGQRGATSTDNTNSTNESTEPQPPQAAVTTQTVAETVQAAPKAVPRKRVIGVRTLLADLVPSKPGVSPNNMSSDEPVSTTAAKTANIYPTKAKPTRALSAASVSYTPPVATKQRQVSITRATTVKSPAPPTFAPPPPPTFTPPAPPNVSSPLCKGTTAADIAKSSALATPRPQSPAVYGFGVTSRALTASPAYGFGNGAIASSSTDDNDGRATAVSPTPSFGFNFGGFNQQVAAKTSESEPTSSGSLEEASSTSTASTVNTLSLSMVDLDGELDLDEEFDLDLDLDISETPLAQADTAHVTNTSASITFSSTTAAATTTRPLPQVDRVSGECLLNQQVAGLVRDLPTLRVYDDAAPHTSSGQSPPALPPKDFERSITPEFAGTENQPICSSVFKDFNDHCARNPLSISPFIVGDENSGSTPEPHHCPSPLDSQLRPAPRLAPPSTGNAGNTSVGSSFSLISQIASFKRTGMNASTTTPKNVNRRTALRDTSNGADIGNVVHNALQRRFANVYCGSPSSPASTVSCWSRPSSPGEWNLSSPSPAKF